MVDPNTGDPVGVFVAGIAPGSPAEKSGAVEVGDRVVAVTGSLGNQMWPHRCDTECPRMFERAA